MTKQRKKPQASPTVIYPDKTTGSEAAARVRTEANQWSAETRARLFEQGMQMIYGGQRPSTTKVRS
jgi:hypothetical protein